MDVDIHPCGTILIVLFLVRMEKGLTDLGNFK